MDSAAKQNLSQNSRKTSESYKTRENAFHKTRERLFFRKLSVSFRSVFGKFENQEKGRFLENFRQIVGECSGYFRFCHLINYLLTGLLVPYVKY